MRHIYATRRRVIPFRNMSTETKVRPLRHKVALVLTWLGPVKYAVKLLVKWLIHVVDLGDNVKSILSFLDGVVHAGDVNLWDIGALTVVLVAAVIVTLFLQKRGPFKALETLSVAATATNQGLPSPVALGPGEGSRSQLTTVGTAFGPKQLSAIGTIKVFAVQYFNQGVTERFRCTCAVTFYGFPIPKASPSELRLSIPEDASELCRLAIRDDSVDGKPGVTLYYGEGDWNALMSAVEKTMSGHPNPNDSSPWTIRPPRSVLYCDLAIGLPHGAPMKQHEESATRMEFELRNKSQQPFRAWISPWRSFDDPPECRTLL